MAECKPAASSTTPTSSCERILTEFQAQGRPSSSTNVVAEGGVMGGFEVKTPRVGTGFIEWALTGYDAGHDLEGKIQNPPAGVNYDKRGDWLYDKNVGHMVDGDDNSYKTPPTNKK
jgi:hypothetical protein